jgi:hypothetical protein
MDEALDGEELLIALDNLAEAEQSDRLTDLPYVVLGLSIHWGVDDPILL